MLRSAVALYAYTIKYTQYRCIDMVSNNFAYEIHTEKKTMLMLQEGGIAGPAFDHQLLVTLH